MFVKSLRGMGGGRVGVWWMGNGYMAKRYALLASLLVIAAWIMSSQYREAIAYERGLRLAVTRELEARKPIEDLPTVTFIIDARTAEQFRIKAAAIAGALDAERARFSPGRK